jgi:hypothetical protein
VETRAVINPQATELFWGKVQLLMSVMRAILLCCPVYKGFVPVPKFCAMKLYGEVEAKHHAFFSQS